MRPIGKRETRNPRLETQSAFTLIELLVVITIIVVLLAMLTPALDKALYQTELAACGATIKGLTTAGIAYAAANKRHYPTREPYAHNWDALQVKLVDNVNPVVHFNIPKQMSEYIGLDSFLDPLGGGVDLNVGLGQNLPTSQEPTLYSNYLVYFGYGHPLSFQRGMRRIGDALVFHDGAEGRTTRFRFLVADLDSRRARADGVWEPDCYSGHPDDEGRLVQITVENKDNPFVKNTPVPIGKLTTSWWWSFSPPQPINRMRGLCDYNYGADDGSVLRLNKVEINDERCEKLPLTNLDEYNVDRKAQLPGSN